MCAPAARPHTGRHQGARGTAQQSQTVVGALGTMHETRHGLGTMWNDHTLPTTLGYGEGVVSNEGGSLHPAEDRMHQTHVRAQNTTPQP